MSTLQPTESGAWVVDPNDPLTLYALGDRSLRSKDGGHTWSELGWPAGAQALLFSHLPVPAMYLQVQASASPSEASSASRLLKSSNGGDSWTDVGSAAGDALLVDLNPQPVFLYAGLESVWRSTDEGANWAAVTLPVGSFELPLQLGRMFASSDASPVLYIEALAFVDLDYESVVLVSTDGGLTFESKVVPASTRSIFPPRLSVDCQGRLYVLDGNTIRRSSDAGSTWQALSTFELDVEQFRVAPGPPTECSDTVYAFGTSLQEACVWRINADGTVSSQVPSEYGVVSDLGRDRLLLASDYETLRQRSDDGGRTWWTAGVELSGALALSPAQQGLLFVASGFTVARSDNDGKSWTVAPTPSGTSIEKVFPDPTNPDVLYASSSIGSEFVSGVVPRPYTFISTDGGASFQNWAVPTEARPEVPEAIASSTSGTVTVVTQSGVYATDDRGQHFATLLSPPHENSILWAGIGASDPPSIYAYIAAADSSANEITVSLDGGATWSSSDPGTYVQCLVPHPTDPQIAFACPGTSGDEAGLLRTLDGGNTWSRIATPGPVWSVQIDPVAPHGLYAIGEHVYHSPDQGDTWQTGPDLPSNASSLQFDPWQGGARYALTQSGLLEKMIE